MQKIKDIVKLIRVKHWIKNILVFVTMFLSTNVTLSNLYKLTIGFFAFSLMSSVVYIINDIVDKDKDAKHSKRKKGQLQVEELV